MKMGFKNSYMQITFNMRDPRNQILCGPLLIATNYHKVGSSHFTDGSMEATGQKVSLSLMAYSRNKKY